MMPVPDFPPPLRAGIIRGKEKDRKVVQRFGCISAPASIRISYWIVHLPETPVNYLPSGFYSFYS